MLIYIPISGLNDVVTSDLSGDDLIPVVDSASLTTYKASVNQLNNWMSQYGSSNSSSWSSASISASYSPVEPRYSASISTYLGTKQDNLVTGNTYTITSSWAANSVTSSNSITASFSRTSSYSETSALARTASYFNFSVSSPSIVTSSISSSWASASLSSSFSKTSSLAYTAVTSSYVTGEANPGIAKAFLTFWVWGKPSQTGTGEWANPVVVSSYNISSITYYPSDLTNPDSVSYPLQPYINEQWRINFTIPMADANYTVIVGGAGEEKTATVLWAIYPFAQDANGFYVTRVGGSAGNSLPNQHDWCQLVVFKM